MKVGNLLSIRVLIPLLIMSVTLALLLQIDVIRSIVGVRRSDSSNNLLYAGKDHCKLESIGVDSGGGIYPAVIAASLRDDPLNDIGGTEHWFHVMERVVPVALESKKSISQARANKSLRNDTILVVFQEKVSAENLSEFSMLVLTAALTGNLYSHVIFGYITSDQVSYDKQVSTNHFQPTFVADTANNNLKQKFQTYDNYIRSSTSIQAAPALPTSNDCFSNVFSLFWSHKAKRKEYTFASSSQFYFIRSAMESICALKPYDASSRREVVEEVNADLCVRSKSSELTVAIEETLLRSDDFVNKQWDIFHEKNKKIKDIYRSCSQGCKKIVIYQRDLNRKIENLDAVSRKIQEEINIWNTNIKIKSKSSLNISESSGCCWDPVVEVITHSNDRPVCELFHRIHRATVLVTAHGFQSALLLFQPLHSTLVEVHPWLAFKPKVYGAMQYGIRDNAGIPRGYIAQESSGPSSSILSSIQSFALSLFTKLSPLFGRAIDSHSCLQQTVCRYLSKFQDVIVSEAFLNKALDAVWGQFTCDHNKFDQEEYKTTTSRNLQNLQDRNSSLSLNREQCSINFGRRRFLTNDEVKPFHRVPPLLYTFPGSGNTWCRLLIEFSSGIFTGSLYNDESLLKVLPGESSCNSHNSVIKAHPSLGPDMPKQNHRIINQSIHIDASASHPHDHCKVKVFPKVILLLRDPFDSFFSEFQREKSKNKSHTGLILKKNFQRSDWEKFGKRNIVSYLFMWEKIYTQIHNNFPPENVLLLRYEDLRNSSINIKELKKIYKFSGFLFDQDKEKEDERFYCAFLQSSSDSTTRKSPSNELELTKFDVYTKDYVCKDIWPYIAKYASIVGYRPYNDYKC